MSLLYGFFSMCFEYLITQFKNANDNHQLAAANDIQSFLISQNFYLRQKFAMFQISNENGTYNTKHVKRLLAAILFRYCYKKSYIYEIESIVITQMTYKNLSCSIEEFARIKLNPFCPNFGFQNVSHSLLFDIDITIQKINILTPLYVITESYY